MTLHPTTYEKTSVTLDPNKKTMKNKIILRGLTMAAVLIGLSALPATCQAQFQQTVTNEVVAAGFGNAVVDTNYFADADGNYTNVTDSRWFFATGLNNLWQLKFMSSISYTNTSPDITTGWGVHGGTAPAGTVSYAPYRPDIIGGSGGGFSGPPPGTVTPPGGSPPKNTVLVSGVPFHGLLLNSGSIKMSDANNNLILGYSTNSSNVWLGDVHGNKRVVISPDGSFDFKGTNGDPVMYFHGRDPADGAEFGIGPEGQLGSHNTGLTGRAYEWNLWSGGKKVWHFATNHFVIESDNNEFMVRYPTHTGNWTNFIHVQAHDNKMKMRDVKGVERMWWNSEETGFKTPDGHKELTLFNNWIDVESALTVNGALSANSIACGNSGFSVSGGAAFASTLDVSGATTLNSTLNVNAAAQLFSTLTVSGGITSIGGISTGNGIHSGNGVGLTNVSSAFSTNAATSITANGTILITNATTGKIFKLVAQQMN